MNKPMNKPVSKRFVVCLGKPLNVLVSQRVIGYATAKSLKWWHGVETIWLFVDESGQLTADQLRDDLGKMSPIFDCLVIEITGHDDTWAALGDDAKNKFKWLNEIWSTGQQRPLSALLPGGWRG